MNSPETTTDRTFQTLADRRRRLVLRRLAETPNEDVPLDSLAAGVARDAGGAATAREKRRVAIELVHVHLPKLADSGLVEVDRDERTVRSPPLPPRLERLLDLAAVHEERPEPNGSTVSRPERN